MIDSADRAKIGADLATVRLEMNAFGTVDGRRVRNGLRIWYIDRFAALETGIVFRGDLVNRVGGNNFFDFIQGNVSRGTDRSTGATGHTNLRLDMKRGVYLYLNPSTGEADGAVAHSLADSCAEAAKNAGVIFDFKSRSFNPVSIRKFFYDRNIRAPGQQ